MTQEHSYKQLFAIIDQPTDPAKIADAVMTRIEMRRLRNARIAMISYGTLIVGAIVVWIPAFNYASTNATQSGFSAYISLALSDGTYLLGAWKNFGLLILESAPILAGAMLLAILLVFAYSIKQFVSTVSVLRPKDRPSRLRAFA